MKEEGESNLSDDSPLNYCMQDLGDCYYSAISEIIDGDTIHLVNGESIRFALVDSPEINTIPGKEAKEFLEKQCPVESTVLIDEDDGQLQKSYGRTIAKIYCEQSEASLNQIMLENNHGKIYKKYCPVSEFKDDDWAIADCK